MVAVRLQVVVRGCLTVVAEGSIHANAEKRVAEGKQGKFGHRIQVEDSEGYW
jgi:hypothetical protein